MDENIARRFLGNLIGAEKTAGIGARSNSIPAFAKLDQSLVRGLKPALRNGFPTAKAVKILASAPSRAGGFAGLLGGTQNASADISKASNGIFAGASEFSGALVASDADTANTRDTQRRGGSREDDIDQIALAAWRARRVDGTRINYDLPAEKEQLWALYPSGEFHYAGIIISGQPVNVPSGKVAIFHTHPKWAEYGPGPEDGGFGVPLYGFARQGLWVLYPGAGAPTVLAGRRRGLR